MDHGHPGSGLEHGGHGGHPGQWHGSHGDHHGAHILSIGPSHGDGHDGSTRTQARVVRSKDSVELHIASHAAVDLKYLFSEMVLQLDLLDIDMYSPGLEEEDGKAWEIKPEANGQMPSGWYPGAKGRTWLWKKYFQLGKREGWLLKGPLVRNPRCGCYLVVECRTISYVEAGDNQTDIVIRVQPLHYWSPYQAAWRYDEFWVRRHLDAAEAASKRLAAVIERDYPPRPEAACIRNKRRHPGDDCSIAPKAGPASPAGGGNPPASGRPGGNAGGSASTATPGSGADLDNLFPDPAPDRSQAGGSPGGGAGSGGE